MPPFFQHLFKHPLVIVNQSGSNANKLGARLLHSLHSFNAVDTTNSDDLDIIQGSVRVEHLSKETDVPERQSVQRRSRHAANSRAVVQDGIKLLVEHERAAKGVCGGDELKRQIECPLFDIGKLEQGLLQEFKVLRV